MAGIQGEFKNGYPFTPYVNLIEYENLTYSSIDLTGNVSGSADKYTAAGFSYDTVNTFATAVEVDGNVTLGVITAALEDGAALTVTLTPDSTYEVDTFTVDLVDKKADLVNGVYSVTAVTANMSFVVTYSLI